MTTHLLELADLAPDELADVLALADELKALEAAGESHRRLPERTLGMLFEKPSTRTRVSFEAGMTQLGGHAICFGPGETQLGRGEPLADTARVLSGYVDFLLARVDDHDDLAELAAHASVPVVNGLSDRAHPVQALADLLTIREAFGGFEGVSAAWVGDGNNVARSFAAGCAMAGVDLTVATPAGYEPDLSGTGAEPALTTDPAEAAAGADVVYTDVWVSMGEAAERAEKLAAFDGFQVDAELLAAAPDARLMHCLPAHRGEEVAGDALDGDRSLVWTQAENRLHTGKALLAWLQSRSAAKTTPSTTP